MANIRFLNAVTIIKGEIKFAHDTPNDGDPGYKLGELGSSINQTLQSSSISA